MFIQRNRFFDMFTVELVGYNTWYANAITAQPFVFNGQTTLAYNGFPAQIVANQNARKAYIRGFYFNAVADLNEYVSFTTSVTYTYARIKDATLGEIPLDHIPPMFGKAGFRINAKRLQTELFTLFNGAKRLQNYASFVGNEDNIQYATKDGTPAWSTLNIRAAYALSSLLTAQVGLENILDVHYRTFASGVSAPGRNLQFSIRVRW